MSYALLFITSSKLPQMNKHLIVTASLLLVKTVCGAQLYIGVTDNDIFNYFPKADIHKIKLRQNSDSICVLVVQEDMRGAFWYNSHRQIITSYQINPVDKYLRLQIELELDKNCFIVRPNKEWSCKKNDYLVQVTTKSMEGKDNTVVETFNYELLK